MLLLPQRIKELRKNRRLSQLALGEVVGVTQQSIARWESGQVTPGADILYELSKYFGVSSDYLLGFTNNPAPFPEITAEEMADLEARADKEAIPITEDELVSLIPVEMQEAMRTLIKIELIKAEERKRKK